MGRGLGEDEGEDGEGMRMMWMIWMMRIRMLGSQSHRMRWNEVGWGEMGRVYAGIKWDGQCIQYLALGAMIGLDRATTGQGKYIRRWCSMKRSRIVNGLWW